MLELKRTENRLFNEYYEGTTDSGYTISCILDDNCVRYIVSKNGRVIKRYEYDNTKKALCFKRATNALNK